MQLQPDLFLGWPAWTLQQGELSLQIVPAVVGRLMGRGCVSSIPP
ncbi:MAG: hypothetical protein WBD81_00360 [Collimonas pratensis]